MQSPGQSAPPSPGHTAARAQYTSARQCQARTANQHPSKCASPTPAPSATLYQERSAALYPLMSAMLYQGNTVLRYPKKFAQIFMMTPLVLLVILPALSVFEETSFPLWAAPLSGLETLLATLRPLCPGPRFRRLSDSTPTLLRLASELLGTPRASLITAFAFFPLPPLRGKALHKFLLDTIILHTQASHL